ncbi:MAG: NAD-dependent epimerase/dehydratase family protein [Bacteroidia bacterium]
MNKPTIIITGANGFIGECLVKHFHDFGWKIKALVHKIPVEKIDNVEYSLYNIEEKISEELFSNVDYLAHCAYLRFEKDHRADELNIEGTKELISLCKKNNVKMLFLSSFSAHPEAESHYGKTKLACEKLFDLSKDIILKTGFVIGKKGLSGEIINRINNSGYFPLVGGGKQPIQTIYINDLCFVIEKTLLENRFGLFNVAEPDAISMKEFYLEIANQLNKKIIFIPIPTLVLLSICKLGELLKIKLPVSSESVLGLKHLIKFDTKADLNKLGLTLKNYKESLKALKN